MLAWAKAEGARVTKSSIMVGLGETEDEVIEAMKRLRDVGVDVVTLGQYLRPTPKHTDVMRYVTPEEFDRYRDAGEAMGFRFVASGPLVRSSYRAAEVFLHGVIAGDKPAVHVDRYGKKKRLAVLT